MGAEHPGSIDKRDVRQRLREVPHESTVVWIVLLGQQPDVIPLSNQPLKESFRIAAAPNSRKILNHPKRTSDKGRFTIFS
jgi:hypothetical protein